MTRFFSDKNRPVHLGAYPLELLSRSSEPVDVAAITSGVPEWKPLSFNRDEQPDSIVNAMREYQAMFDTIRDGFVNPGVAEIPTDPEVRAQHIKSFAYFNDAGMSAVCELHDNFKLGQSFRNPDIDRLAQQLKTTQTKTLAAGIDAIMADLRESMDAPAATPEGHTHAIVLLYEYPRDPQSNEPGTRWIQDAQAHRACLLATENAVILANYLRLLGFKALAHTATTSDFNLHALAVASGLASIENGTVSNPYLGTRFGLAAVTTDFAMQVDYPLTAGIKHAKQRSHGWRWKTGYGFRKNQHNFVAFSKRNYVDGPHPFEKLKRVDTPTTFIDEPNIPRVPKRTDMFARAQFGDLGKHVQDGALNGKYAIKSAVGAAERRPLGALVLLQNQTTESTKQAGYDDPDENAAMIKACSYFLGVDAAGLSRCPEWTWYSHDATGKPVTPPHDQSISMIIDQGYETMEGASGDDWISVAQSMRAYLRFSLLGGVIAKHLRNLGFEAKPHTVLDGEVLQPPLLLLSGLGEVSRIGEVILNPYLGPRLKSGVVTTTMPMAHDKPIDFGLQTFCESCNKCARECPSGAITAGPKLMFNGYEIWKSDSQKCATYRITTPGGAMCGRCMKTCPWNLEGIFAEKPFRWAAMNIPSSAPVLAKLDDLVDNGGLNPTKKWWWDIELKEDGHYGRATAPVNQRSLQKNLKVLYKEQTLAVYPAPLAPHPYPYPYLMDREKGIEAYQALLTAEQYQLKLAQGTLGPELHTYQADGESPVVRVRISKIEKMSDAINKYEMESMDGSPLPTWQAGAHLDIVVAPGVMRQYSLSGDPADHSRYQIAVLREDEGKGGSKLLHRIFTENRAIFVSKPINHFALDQTADKFLLLGGGIGVTPMVAMAHELHRANREFRLHYSCSNRESAGFLTDLEQFSWTEQVSIHVSSEGSRADFRQLLQQPAPGTHIYLCGPEAYMQSIEAIATELDWPEEHVHQEYFHVPDAPDYVNHPFTLRLAKADKEIVVTAEESATDALTAAGIPIDVKCSDGLCGVCKCKLLNGDVEHRDYVLSKAQQQTKIILCQSRASKANGVLEIDL